MVGIYLAVACIAVIIVAFFVDDLPADLVDRKTNVRSEVCRLLNIGPFTYRTSTYVNVCSFDVRRRT